eukprot:symbB.v1.2.032593.t1/scaffold3933.1/size58575/3
MDSALPTFETSPDALAFLGVTSLAQLCSQARSLALRYVMQNVSVTTRNLQSRFEGRAQAMRGHSWTLRMRCPGERVWSWCSLFLQVTRRISVVCWSEGWEWEIRPIFGWNSQCFGGQREILCHHGLGGREGPWASSEASTLEGRGPVDL